MYSPEFGISGFCWCELKSEATLACVGRRSAKRCAERRSQPARGVQTPSAPIPAPSSGSVCEHKPRARRCACPERFPCPAATSEAFEAAALQAQLSGLLQPRATNTHRRKRAARRSSQHSLSAWAHAQAPGLLHSPCPSYSTRGKLGNSQQRGLFPAWRGLRQRCL